MSDCKHERTFTTDVMVQECKSCGAYIEGPETVETKALAAELAEAKLTVRALNTIVRGHEIQRDALRAALEQTAEALEVSLGRLGVCLLGDGADHRADVDSWGGTAALTGAREALRGTEVRDE